MAAERRYWDTACFLAVLGEEAGRVEVCAPILRAATKRTLDLEIVTSAFTITEVLYPRGGQPLSPAIREKVKRFFRNPGIVLVVVDREIAESAQEQFWDHGVRPKDAVHIASALAAKVPVFETYDVKLLKLSGKVGDGTLIIREPVPVFGSSGAIPPPPTQGTLFDTRPGASDDEGLDTRPTGPLVLPNAEPAPAHDERAQVDPRLSAQ